MVTAYLLVTVQARSQSQLYYITTNNGSGNVLDVYGNGTSDGTPVDVATPNGGTSQVWQFVRLSNGYYQILAGNGSGLVLDVFGDGTAGGTPVDIATPNGTTAQQWQMIEDSNGNFQIIVENGSGNVLDVYGNGASSGTMVDSGNPNGSTAQVWTLVPVSGDEGPGSGSGGSILAPTSPSAPGCMGLAGNWTDSQGFTYNLQQSGTSFSGTVQSVGCDGDGIFNISGGVDNSGNYSFTASETSTTGCPASSWNASGSDSGTGCNDGNWSWVNSLSETGSVTWDEGCKIPDYETSSTANGIWGSDPGFTTYDFDAGVVSYDGYSFGGRHVAETDAGGGSDGCHFYGSIYGPLTTVQTQGLVVSADGRYDDQVGLATKVINYYRAQRSVRGLSMPCEITNYQKMQIACSSMSDLRDYKTNQLTMCLYGGSFTVCRPGECNPANGSAYQGTCVATTSTY